ncbi:DegT/DnrJ/EryC1/StrS family aminotransferase [Candidatus Synechococcus calcipolaris G9]|uniref:DegT/DnrJ/EryC1/StrS family aminotransferase n=1 Tax=Candidatus Synechococcus calcipolaris G9 TaxID=1497997 RepID=A0ABT6EY05_9SYNE|nr:DegT/DnrJ/EryC1/StrS family aminotransferase [Candidatus Synechococcus calcipolaris]MDG2989973.1 DegT/DnrJ/EryC1/StrS family aminotransferase [Candidatus Synechococcus calcipolaris G9]
MEHPPIPIALPSTGEEEWRSLRDPLMKGWLTQGPQVAAFEQAFAQRHQTKHGIATTSCTTALHLILVALGIGPGDEVIVPAFTWVSTANVVRYCGATPVLVDVDRQTFNLDISQVQNKLTVRTKAIMPVHLFGRCVDMDSLEAVTPGIPIIEDAACGAGSLYRGRSAGSLGLAGAFSFHPRKTITTGEGGMITTNNDELAETLRILRNHGASISEEQRHLGPRPYILPDFNLLGFNYRMTDLQGAVGLVQLGKLDRLIAEREEWAGFYQRELAELDWLRTPEIPAADRSGWQAYVCYVDEAKAPMARNQIMEALQSQGISTRPGTHAVHLLGIYKDEFGFKPEDYPAARDCDAYSIALPLHNRMESADYHHIVKTLKKL